MCRLVVLLMVRNRSSLVASFLTFSTIFWASTAIGQVCPCENGAMHGTSLPEPGLRCMWFERTRVSIPTKVISHPKKRKTILATETCEADCRLITGCVIWEPHVWNYNAEGRETISGSVTQPDVCNPAGTVVGFAIEVCNKIGAGAAVRDVAGYISIDSNTFSGIAPWSHSCAQCMNREDEFWSETESVDGKLSRTVKITWESVPEFVGNSCSDETPTTSQVCPIIKCSVSRTVKTFHRVVYNEHCSPDAPELCGIEVCP